MKIDVRHDDKKGKFYADIEGAEAVIEYDKRPDGTYDLMHTYVPPELRGKGIAEDLVRQSLEQIRAEGAKMVPSCPYVHKFVEGHQEYKDLVK